MRMHTSLPHVTRTTLSPSRPARTTGTTGDEKQRLAVLISTPGVLLPSYLALEQPHPRHHQTHPGTGTPAASTQDGQQARAPAAGGHSTWPLTVWAGKWLPRGASVAQDLPATPNKHRHQSERQLIHRPGHRCDPPMRPCRCPLRPRRAHGTLSTYRCRWRGSGTPCMTSAHPRGRQPGGSTPATPCITPPNQTWHAHTRLGGAGPYLVPALRSHERRLSREWPLFWPGSRSRTCAHPAKHALSTAFAATSTPPRKGHLQAHQTAESDAAPRGKASPTTTLHEPGAGGGGEDRQADI